MVLVHVQPAIGRASLQAIGFEHAFRVRAEILQKGAIEDQVTAVDEPFADLRLLAEQQHATVLMHQLAKSAGWSDGGHGRDAIV